jgi:hypothetical protein
MLATQLLQSLKAECISLGLSDQIEKRNRSMISLGEGIKQLQERISQKKALPLSEKNNKEEQITAEEIMDTDHPLIQAKSLLKTTKQQRADLISSFKSALRKKE